MPMEIVVPHIYIDTNVIVDIIEGQRRSSVHLIETVKERGWICSTSNFAVMEVLDVRKENAFIFKKLSEGHTLKKILRLRYEKDLSEETLQDVYNKVYNKFFIPYKFIQFFWLTKEGWDKAIEICANSNISTSDCIHVATALEAGCDILVTSDESFEKNASKFISTCLPENFIDGLRKLNFEV